MAGRAEGDEQLVGSHTKPPGPQPGRNFAQVAKLACMQEQVGETQCAQDPEGQGRAALQTRAALPAPSKFLQILGQPEVAQMLDQVPFSRAPGVVHERRPPPSRCGSAPEHPVGWVSCEGRGAGRCKRVVPSLNSTLGWI